MLFIKDRITIFFVWFILSMNAPKVFGSFLENFVTYSTIHMIKGSTNDPSNSGFDPLSFKRHFSIDDSLLRLDLSFNGVMKGFSNYTLDKIDISPDLSVSFIGTLIDTQISGSYEVNGSYYSIVPLLGNGAYIFLLKNVRIALDTRVHPNDGHIEILAFDLDYNYDDFEISIGGLSGDEAVGNVLKDFNKDLISIGLKKEKPVITKYLKGFILKQGNDQLKTMTLRSMIELVKELFVY